MGNSPTTSEPNETPPVDSGLLPTVSAAASKMLVMREIEHLSKTQRNDQQKFMFRGIDDAMQAVGPALRKHGGLIEFDTVKIKRVQGVSRQGGALMNTLVKVRCEWHGTDGGAPLVSTFWGEAMDSGDKSTTKAISVAIRQFYLHTLVIPTMELSDPDRDVYERGTPSQTAGQAAKARPQAETLSSVGAQIMQLLPGKNRSELHKATSYALGVEDDPKQKFTLEELITARDALQGMLNDQAENTNEEGGK